MTQQPGVEPETSAANPTAEPAVKRAGRSGGSRRVLGIDPGTRVVGYGILDLEAGKAPAVLAHGAIRLPPSPLAARLERLFHEVTALIAAHRPQVLSIERVFYGKNFQSALKVGEARGVVVLAAQLGGLEVHEYTPAAIKKTATGNGNAAKDQVQGMMRRILGFIEAPEPPDVTDALAAAFCHGQRLRGAGAVREPPAKAGRGSGALRAALRSRRGQRRRGEAGPAEIQELIRRGKARAFTGIRFRKTSTKPRRST